MKLMQYLKIKEIKENLMIAIGCICIFALLALSDSNVKPATASTLQESDFIRFHVIANSNTQEDQGLKLKVKDEMVRRLNEELLPMESIEQSRTYIKNNISNLTSMAEDIIHSQGYEYPVKVWLGNRFIPEKTYGDVTFPAGNYEALNIEIGQAQGENWWCVLFPPLCLIDSSNDSGQNADTVEKQKAKDNIIKSKKYDQIMESQKQGTPLKLKFKTAEILKDK